MSYLERAIEQLNIDPERVIRHREQDGDYVILADYGIGGTKKYRIPLSRLPAPSDDGLDVLSYRELQELAKAVGIPANQSAADLRAALSGYESHDSAEEEE